MLNISYGENEIEANSIHKFKINPTQDTQVTQASLKHIQVSLLRLTSS